MSQPFQLGILGYPLHHTLSPQLHQFFLDESGLTGTYQPFEIPVDALPAWLAELPAMGLNGFNVTIPHKLAVMSACPALSDTARGIGAVNTVICRPEGLYGDNTDATGFLSPLSAERRRALHDSHTVIIGAGGSSRAVAYGLLSLGVSQLTFLVRDVKRAAETILQLETMKALTHNTAAQTQIVSDIVEIDLQMVQCLVNTTPVGMHPDIEPLSFPHDALMQLPINALVYDLIYNPFETALLRQARQFGLATQSGLDMLIGQGAESFTLWTGQTLSDTTLMAAKTLLGLSL